MTNIDPSQFKGGQAAIFPFGQDRPDFDRHCQGGIREITIITEGKEQKLQIQFDWLAEQNDKTGWEFVSDPQKLTYTIDLATANIQVPSNKGGRILIERFKTNESLIILFPADYSDGTDNRPGWLERSMIRNAQPTDANAATKPTELKVSGM